MSHYEPIDCNFYDILEALATRKRYIQIHYKIEIHEFQTVDSIIKDLYIKQGFEYMPLANGTEIRLDHLIKVGSHYLPGKGFDHRSCECD